ncbi:D-TA family PLP-dependent enzyme [Arvimicrobium flavum]|uniref:D-TA family PLP-dependent enzyme n=1 Tax=Arvimicrobium flavum TaxID=3393320 RepID=UPI00237BE55E|nr:D-TA family PLP-dependent enzyme [Mesorhizobium shangrilense]
MTADRTIDDLETPCVLVDLDRASANILRAQAYADAHGKKLRPHIKTHKLPFWARKQVEAGAVGITCQKIGEAEVMADAGIADIFLPYNIIGRQKLERLLALHRRITLSVTADSRETIEGLASVFTDPDHRLTVLVECDTGMARCGVQSPQEALDLAKRIDAAPGLRFGGLMTYPAAGKAAEANAWLKEARDLLAKQGIACERISSGGTPDMWHAGDSDVITEYRPGTYIYLDRYQVAKDVGTADNCALTVLATVVSKPTATRAILDSGSKALTSDTLGMDGFGEIVGIPGASVTGLSEEHGNVTLAAGADLSIGDRVRILPNHACVVSNLFDEVHLVSGDRVIETVPVAARGRVD